jgi:hypothetical protein
MSLIPVPTDTHVLKFPAHILSLHSWVPSHQKTIDPCPMAAKRLLFLVNRSPTDSQWIRSPQEREIQKRICTNLLSLINQYLLRSYGIEGIIYFVDHHTYNHKRYLEFRTPETTIVNFCTGSDLDGLIGPTVAISLEKNNIPFLGPSSVFLLNVIDKRKLKETLQKKQVAVRPFRVVRASEPPQGTLPLVLNPADSYYQPNHLITNEEQLQTVWTDLGQHFPLFILEEHRPHLSYEILINDATMEHHPDVPQDAATLAKTAYYCLGGSGPALVTVGLCSQTGSFFIEEVKVVGILEFIHQMYGLDKALLVLNKTLSKCSL